MRNVRLSDIRAGSAADDGINDRKGAPPVGKGTTIVGSHLWSLLHGF